MAKALPWAMPPRVFLNGNDLSGRTIWEVSHDHPVADIQRVRCKQVPMPGMPRARRQVCSQALQARISARAAAIAAQQPPAPNPGLSPSKPLSTPGGASTGCSNCTTPSYRR